MEIGGAVGWRIAALRMVAAETSPVSIKRAGACSGCGFVSVLGADRSADPQNPPSA
jgi:hypothetical protein